MPTATATNTSAAPDMAQMTAASALQALLPDLVALTLDAKQAHWNVTGPAFLPLHALTDEIAADTRAWSDRVAERAVALGYSVDGRPATVASTVTDELPAGWLPDQDMIAELARRITGVGAKAHNALTLLDNADAVAHDITVDIIEGLEKYRWMLRAHNAQSTSN